MNSAEISMLPYPPLLLHVLRTSAVIWLLVRSAYVLLLLAGILVFGLLPPEEGIAAALHPTALSRVLIVALTAFLVWIDRKRAHEDFLQANFGVSSLWFWAASLVSAGVLDVAVQALIRFA